MKETEQLLAGQSSWCIIETEDPTALDGVRVELYRALTFSTYSSAFKFMNDVSEQVIVPLDHHPTWRNRWNRVEIWLTTSDAGNRLTTLDGEFVERVEKIWAAPGSRTG